MPLRLQQTLPVVLALLAGLLLRAAFLHARPEVGGDTLIYGNIAQNVLQHHVYGITSYGAAGAVLRPTYIRLPGYPLLLAATFAVFGAARYTAVLWINVVLDLATCLLVGRVTQRLGGRRAGMAALWLAALCPFTANYCAVALTETPSLFCVALAFFALERLHAATLVEGDARRPLAWGVVIGLALLGAVLLRPEQGLLAAAVVPAMVWIGWHGWQGAGQAYLRLRGLVPAAVASLIVALPLLGWGIRNARVMGRFQPLAPRSATDPTELVPTGFEHWYRTWGVDFKSTFEVYWNYDGAPLLLSDLPPRAIEDDRQRAQTEAVLDAYNEVETARPEFEAQFERIAEERQRAHPVRTLIVLPVARVVNMWLRPRTELTGLPLDWWAWRSHPGASVREALYALLNAAFLALGVAGAWRERRRLGPVLASMLAFVLLRSALLLTLDNSEPRYTLECFPVVLVCCGLALRRQSQAAGTFTAD